MVFVQRNPEAASRVLCLTGAQVSFGRAPSPSVAFRVTPTGVPLLGDCHSRAASGLRELKMIFLWKRVEKGTGEGRRKQFIFSRAE